MDVLAQDLCPGDRLVNGYTVLTLYEAGGLVVIETQYHHLYYLPDQPVRLTSDN